MMPLARFGWPNSIPVSPWQYPNSADPHAYVFRPATAAAQRSHPMVQPGNMPLRPSTAHAEGLAKDHDRRSAGQVQVSGPMGFRTLREMRDVRNSQADQNVNDIGHMQPQYESRPERWLPAPGTDRDPIVTTMLNATFNGHMPGMPAFLPERDLRLFKTAVSHFLLANGIAASEFNIRIDGVLDGGNGRTVIRWAVIDLPPAIKAAVQSIVENPQSSFDIHFGEVGLCAPYALPPGPVLGRPLSASSSRSSRGTLSRPSSGGSRCLPTVEICQVGHIALHPEINQSQEGNQEAAETAPPAALPTQEPSKAQQRSLFSGPRSILKVQRPLQRSSDEPSTIPALTSNQQDGLSDVENEPQPADVKATSSVASMSSTHSPLPNLSNLLDTSAKAQSSRVEQLPSGGPVQRFVDSKKPIEEAKQKPRNRLLPSEGWMKPPDVPLDEKGAKQWGLQALQQKQQVMSSEMEKRRLEALAEDCKRHDWQLTMQQQEMAAMASQLRQMAPAVQCDKVDDTSMLRQQFYALHQQAQQNELALRTFEAMSLALLEQRHKDWQRFRQIMGYQTVPRPALQ